MRKIYKISLVVIALLIAVFLFNFNKIKRLKFALDMFSGKEQVERFKAIENYFPVTEIIPSSEPYKFNQISNVELPEKYKYKGESKPLKTLLDLTDVTGLIVIKNDTIIYENYFKGVTPKDHTIVWSVTKSFVSALMGIAINEGYVKSINDRVHQYLPELKETAYGDVTIKNLLQMSSGISWNEDYGDYNSDINRFGRTLALGRSFEAFVKTLSTDKPQGTYNRYNSSDTQVLGMIISSATGKSLSKYLEEKIWQPLGMEQKGVWLVDNEDMEFAAAGLSASLIDLAKFGRLYLNSGSFNGKQILSQEWVKSSITPDAQHLEPGKNENSNNRHGYGYQWWVLESNEGEYAAEGIYNQMIYINPTHNIIIAKTAANNTYGVSDDDSSYREKESLAMLRAIVESIK